jgi:hypothetical protein
MNVHYLAATTLEMPRRREIETQNNCHDLIAECDCHRGTHASNRRGYCCLFSDTQKSALRFDKQQLRIWGRICQDTYVLIRTRKGQIHMK